MAPPRISRRVGRPRRQRAPRSLLRPVCAHGGEGFSHGDARTVELSFPLKDGVYFIGQGGTGSGSVMDGEGVPIRFDGRFLVRNHLVIR